MQVLATADCGCVDAPSPYYASSHNKVIFNDSQVIRFLTINTDDDPEREGN
jgi:hypothetical protein